MAIVRNKGIDNDEAFGSSTAYSLLHTYALDKGTRVRIILENKQISGTGRKGSFTLVVCFDLFGFLVNSLIALVWN